MNRLERYTPYALAALRIMAALLFMQHGLQKLLLFPAPSIHGTPGPWTLVWFGGWIEAAGGALIAAGLFTRQIAFLASGEMAIGYFMIHAGKGFYPVLNGGDLPILFCFVFLFFVFAGPGAFNLEDVLFRRPEKSANT